MALNISKNFFQSILYISCFLLLYDLCFGQKPKCLIEKPAADPYPYEEFVFDLGNLHNYVCNSTYAHGSGHNEQSFTIGRADLKYPSMMWLEGGYENNHYLYFGAFRIGYNDNDIRFHTATSEGIFHDTNNPNNISPYTVSFSMTDDSAGSNKVGVKCINKISAWPEPDRSDVLVYEYFIINNSGQIMEDVYAGINLDCDVSSAGGGSDVYGFWRDDYPEYFLGTDTTGNPEAISYMYDGDNPSISGNDIGGIFNPKESTGYIGSRVIACPPSKHGVPANQASGHHWWDW